MFSLRQVIAVLCLALAPAALDSQSTTAPASRSCEEIESFLLNGKLGTLSPARKGITGVQQSTMEHNGLQHTVYVSTIDDRKTTFQSAQGTELNFRDSWKFNVAGYRLARLLGLNMVPPYVESRVSGKSASFTWGVPNVAMDEVERKRKNIDPPDLAAWNRQMYVVRVFDQLIHNMDRNLTNLLITTDWQIWMIDHGRAFRLHKSLKEVKNLVQCDRRLLARMRELDKPLLQKHLRPYVTDGEIDGLLGRRDRLVAFFEKEVAAKGEAAILYDLDRSSQPCGVGL